MKIKTHKADGVITATCRARGVTIGYKVLGATTIFAAAIKADSDKWKAETGRDIVRSRIDNEYKTVTIKTPELEFDYECENFADILLDFVAGFHNYFPAKH